MTCLSTFFIILLIISGSVMAQNVQDFIDCLDVIVYLSSCIGYINGQMKDPVWNCCVGVEELNRLARLKHQVHKICQCIELVAATVDPPFLLAKIDDLPIKCHTHLSFPISISKNCSTVQ